MQRDYLNSFVLVGGTVLALQLGNRESVEIPGVKFLDPASAVVVSVKMARGATKPADDDDDEEEEA